MIKNKFYLIFIFLIINTCYAMSQKYETQEYEVIESINEVELRYYPSAPMIKVSDKYNRNSNFGKLFRYITGSNLENEKIAMTTPVYMYNDNKTMEFVLPKKYIKDQIPEPNDKNVEVYISRPKYFAAIRFSGYSNEKKIEKNKTILQNILKENDIEIISDFYLLVYDAPTKFYNRRNEILFEIKKNN